MPLRRALPDWAIPVGLACMVVAFASASSSVHWIHRYGHHVRWIVLVVVCAAAVAEATRRLRLERRPPPRGVLRFGALAGSFLVLAVASTAWSVAPQLTFERAASLGILFALAWALAVATADDVRALVRLFQGLAAGAIAVGLLGLLVLVFDYDAAVGADVRTWRYEGFTENPNTIAILAGATLPVLVGLAIAAASRGARTAWLGGALLMLASVVAAESRGGLLAACAGTLVVTAFGVEGARHRVAAAAAVVAVFGGGIALRQAVEPPPPQFTSEVVAAPQSPPPARANNTGRPTAPGTGSRSGHKGRAATPKGTAFHKRTKNRAKSHAGSRRHKRRHGPRPLVQLQTKPVLLPNEQDEIGHPQLSKTASSTLGSGRVAAWKGALELVGDRPILGYGFGTESRVFIDRWYFFQGNSTENSYLGLLLQVGVVGLALILAVGCALLVGGVRALRSLTGDARTLVVIELGVLVSAAGVMLIQSYLYSVGNIATATTWISLFVLGPVALAPRPTTARGRAAAREAVA